MELPNAKIGIVGTGAIGGALIDRLVDGLGHNPTKVLACETDDAKRKSIETRFGVRVYDTPQHVAGADIIVLAVPPPVVPTILAAIRDGLSHRPLIVSFAAALPVAFLEAALPTDISVVRVNPNSPSLVGHGYNPVTFGSTTDGAVRDLADSFLAALGTSVEVPDEQMNLYTALTAVGPTYFLPVFDAMIQYGKNQGLARKDAVTAAVETARGVAAMVANRDTSPEDLRLYTGLRPLDHESARNLVTAAVDDAHTRMHGVQAKITSS